MNKLYVYASGNENILSKFLAKQQASLGTDPHGKRE